ncbi:MAG: hypothetical protein N3D20_02965 [Candidatus Pacearchaeota archaeon]|nr:hypothetical protein [Candidatus Pacearchaeota archaeon]
MIGKKEIDEIKAHLEKAQNPIFYYDNDADGLCSFLILRRAFGKGKGVAVRSYPELDESYSRKARELKADYIFVLDKPVIGIGFLKKIDEMQLPLVWIDHHPISEDAKKEFGKFANFYRYDVVEENDGIMGEPVSSICYRILKKKEDLWIAVIGSVADHYLPDYIDEFVSAYPEWWGKNIKKPFDAYYKSEIGRIAIALNFGLKDSVTHVVEMQNFLINCKGPDEVLEEKRENRHLIKKYKEIRQKYNELLERAKMNIKGKVIFFDYSGDLSISSDLANELIYLYPKKYVAVAYKKGAVTNISMRGDDVRTILDKILKNFENATGGGHRDAVGAKIKTSDLERFKELFFEEVTMRKSS